ncbi:MAG: T9SS type A sorting domain-containing protein [Bacteroidia bacterium]|nr:T9SS type A sorting domain-containing protein [Bacteroidia bacterium]
MKKTLWFVVGLCTVLTFNAQNFALYYSFASVTPSSGVVDPTPTPTAVGVSAGSFSAIGLSANPTTTNVFAFTGWGTGATNNDNTNFTGSIDLNKKFEVSLTPQSGYGISIDSIHFYMNRSATGPRMWSLRSSVSGYSVNLPAQSISSHTNIQILPGNVFFWANDSYTNATWFNKCVSKTFSLTAHQLILNTVFYSFHAWNAEGTGGSFRIDSVVFNGKATFGAGLKNYTHNLKSHFYLIPNPSSKYSQVNIKSSIPYNKIEIISIDGKLIQTLENDESVLYLNTEGIYFVKIHTNQGVLTDKLIVN